MRQKKVEMRQKKVEMRQKKVEEEEKMDEEWRLKGEKTCRQSLDLQPHTKKPGVGDQS